MRQIKNKIVFSLCLLLILTSLSTPAAMAVSGDGATSPVSDSMGNMSRWLLDEANGNIYAVSSDSDKLLFIDSDTLNLKKELEITGIQDIALLDGKLYAAIETKNQIAVIDVKTATIEKTLSVKNSPYKIAAADNKLFYILRKWGVPEQQLNFTKVYSYNLDGSGEVAISPLDYDSSMNYFTNLAADPTTHRLYLSFTNDYSSTLLAISTNDYQPEKSCGEATYDRAALNIIINGGDIYYGWYRLDKNDLTKAYGSYEYYVTYASGNDIFTQNGIFDRVSFIKTGKYDYEGEYTMFLADSKGMAYLYKGPGSPLQKVPLSALHNLETGSGNPGDDASSDYNADNVGADTMAKRFNITRWLADPGRNMIYALSKDNNTLLFIRLNDLKLQKQLVVGKSPSYLVQDGSKLFIALSDINQAAVVDLDSRTVEDNLLLKVKPGAMAIDGDKLFYMGHEESSSYQETYMERTYNLFVYNLKDKSDIRINENLLYDLTAVNLALDKDRHILYFGGMGAGEACAVSTTDYKLLGTSGGGPLQNAYGSVSLSDGDVIFSRFKVSGQDMASAYGFFTEPIIYTSSGYAFSKSTVYDANSHEKIADLPFESDNIYMDASYNVYMFNRNSNSISRFSLKSSIDSFPGQYSALIKNIDYKLETDDYWNMQRKLNIDKIELDEQKGLIYAISATSYKLHIIGMDDLKLRKELIVGYAPTDMELYAGKLYIAVSGAKYVLVVDTSTLDTQRIYLSENPSYIAVDDGKLYYMGEKLHVYDIDTKKDTPLSFYDFEYGWEITRSGALFLDKDNHILYGYTGSSTILSGISTESLKAIPLPADIKVQNTIQYDGMPIFEGNEFFAGQDILERSTLKKVLHKYYGKILYADDKFILTSYGLYLRYNGAKLGDMPGYYDNFHMDENGNVYMMSYYGNSIKKTTIDEIYHSLVNKTDAYYKLEADGGVVIPEEEKPVNFTDIDNHWAKEDIEYLAEKKIVNGIGGENAQFAPDATVTRAEFVAMLVRMLEIDSSEGVGPRFIDVSSNAWYFEPILAASYHGLVKGTGIAVFSPDAPVTRQEIAALAVRAMEYKGLKPDSSNTSILSSFRDADSISAWAKGSAAVAVEVGIMTGIPGKQFAPGANATRAESAVVLKRLLDKIQ